MAVSFTSTYVLLHDNNRLILVPCFVGSPKSPDVNLTFIEIESRLREKIRVNADELRQVNFIGWFVVLKKTVNKVYASAKKVIEIRELWDIKCIHGDPKFLFECLIKILHLKRIIF